MGNGESYDQYITTEFERIRNSKKTKHDYLELEDILRFQSPPAHPTQDLDLTHLGTLFVMERSKTGKFYLDEVIAFVTLYLEKHAKNKTNVDFLVCIIEGCLRISVLLIVLVRKSFKDIVHCNCGTLSLFEVVRRLS